MDKDALVSFYRSGSWLTLKTNLDAWDLQSSPDPELFFLRAQAERFLGFPELSFSDFAKALQLDAEAVELRLAAAEAMLEGQRLQEARSLLTSAQSQSAAQTPIGRWILARCNTRLGDPAAAEDDLLLLQDEATLDRERLGIGLAEVNILLGDFDRAEFCLNRLFELSPGCEDAVLLKLELLCNVPVDSFSDVMRSYAEQFPSKVRIQLAVAKALVAVKDIDGVSLIFNALQSRGLVRGRVAAAYARWLVDTAQLSQLRGLALDAPESYPLLDWSVLEAQCLYNNGQFDAVVDILSECGESFDVEYIRLQSLIGLRAINDARSCLARLQVLCPDQPNRLYDCSAQLLKFGHWQSGWKLYENRFLASIRRQIVPEGISPKNSSRSPLGCRVVVFGEQGIGDTIMMASMIPDLSQQAKDVTVLLQPRLVEIFKSSFPDLTVVTSLDREVYEAKDRCYGFGSLGQFYRLSRDHFPGSPYLKVSAESEQLWSNKLRALGPGLKVGVAWSGGGQITSMNQRSVDLIKLLPILSVKGVTWINLQYRHDPNELEVMNASHGIEIHHYDGITKDIYQTVALTMQLDLVITVQQTALHLAGGAGVPAWVILPVVPEWRYGVDGPSMSWYSSVELFRQQRHGEWNDPIDAIRSRLEKLVALKAGQNNLKPCIPS